MNDILKKGWLAMVLAFLYAPILALILYSFNSARYSAEWEGFTLQWYANLADGGELMQITFNSIFLAIASATGATILGLIGAVALKRYQFAGKALLKALIYVLLMSPDIVMGIALLVIFVALQLDLGFWTLFLSHVTFSIPFVIVTILGRLEGLDENLTQAAHDLGCNDWQTFRMIIAPLMLPAIFSGWLLAFTLSMDDVIISFFVSGPDFEILPLRIYSMVRLGVKPEINALCTILFLLTMGVVFASRKLVGEKE